MKIDIYNWNLLKNFSISKKKLSEAFQTLFNDDVNLNIVFVEKKDIKRLNTEFRSVNKATDVLTFGPYEDVGEIYICPEVAMDIPRTIIHGILHLKGYEHDESLKGKMYELEEKYLKRFYDILGCK